MSVARGRPPSVTRKLLRELHIEELREMVDFYRLDRDRTREVMIERLVKEVGTSLDALVSAEGPLSLREWNQIVDEIGGTRRKTFALVRDEIDMVLDPVTQAFDRSMRISELRQDRHSVRRLARLLDVENDTLSEELRSTHGSILLGNFLESRVRTRDIADEDLATSTSDAGTDGADPQAPSARPIPEPPGSAPVPLEPDAPKGAYPVAADVVAGTSTNPSPQAIRFEEYLLVERLPGGAGGEAWRVENASGETRFMKRAWAHGFEARALEREQNIYQKLISRAFPHILRVHDYKKVGDYVFLVTDFAGGGTLKEHVDTQGGELAARDVKPVAAELAQALVSLHNEGVVHRDLKPQNILRSKSGWYLADFGIAKNLDRLITHHTLFMIGTRGYMAPEQRRGTEAAPSADVFSFGKIVTFMLTGQTDPDRIQQEAWWSFVRGCTASEPAARPESTRLVTLLSDLPT